MFGKAVVPTGGATIQAGACGPPHISTTHRYPCIHLPLRGACWTLGGSRTLPLRISAPRSQRTAPQLPSPETITL